MTDNFSSPVIARLDQLMREESLLRKDKQRQHRSRGKDGFWLFVLGQVVPFLVALVLIFLGKQLSIERLSNWGLIFLLGYYVMAISYPFLMLYRNQDGLLDFFKYPHAVLLRNSDAAFDVDSRHISALSKFPKQYIELALLEVKAEADFFLRRINLVSGAIDKIGLFSALLGAIAAISQLHADQPRWVQALAYAIPALQIFGMSGHMIAMRMERVVRLLELTLLRCNAVEKA